MSQDIGVTQGLSQSQLQSASFTFLPSALPIPLTTEVSVCHRGGLEGGVTWFGIPSVQRGYSMVPIAGISQHFLKHLEIN